MSQKMKTIFISYAHKDSPLILRVIDTMQSRGFNVWYDDGIKEGSEWSEYIAANIESCECFIAFMSENYIESKYCKREVNFAIEENKQLFVVYLDSVRPSAGMRLQLDVIQAMYRSQNITDEEFIDNICRVDMLQKCKKTDGSPTSQAGTVFVENMKGSTGKMTYLYTGYLLNGMRSGPGKSIYSNGDVYEGDYKNDKRHGFGKYIWFGGNTYEGGWKDGQPHGKGKYSGANGESFIGELKDGKYHGQGTYIHADGCRYDGSFRNGVFDGYGRYVYSNGDVYEGDFVGGKKHGYGKFRQSNGAVYEGEYKYGKCDGYGKYVYVSGDMYEGEFRNDMRHGRGKYIYVNGRIEVGNWVEGKNMLF